MKRNMTMELEDKYFVLKYEDIETILTTEEQAQLFRMARMIRFIRIERGKKDNKYVVINQDEPYFPAVLKLMEAAEQAPLKAEDTAQRRSQGAKDGWEICRAKQAQTPEAHRHTAE